MVDFYYKKYGNGINKIIFFHGFGQNHTAFEKSITQILKESDVTCYAIDIYYHGKSQRKNRPLQLKQLETSFQQFLETENVKSFTSIGYSLGGRFVLAISTLFPHATECIFLLAPDGVFQSTWYRLANTRLGNTLFKYLMDRPVVFDQLVNTFRRIGIVSKPLGRFVETILNSEQQRTRVYQTWTYFHSLQLQPKAIASCFNQYQIPIHVIVGDQDRIIPPQKVLPKLNTIKHLKSVILNARHHQIITESTPYIISALKNPNL